MSVSALKTAIVNCCVSDGFTPEKVEDLISKYRKEYPIKEDFLKICSLAAESCNISVFFLLDKTRDLAPVMGRRLVFLYYRSKGLTLNKCGKKFKQDHVTAKHGIDTIHQDIWDNHTPTIKASIKFYKLIQEYESNTIKTDGCIS